MTQEPPAVEVPYNDWRQVPMPPTRTFAPTLPVTVVISYFEAPDALELTLAALEGQTYPRDLIEVIVVDDGSRTPLAPPSTPLDLKVVYQEDRGFGLARARNNGASAATHDILVFLDGDMIADSGLLAAHARWHHVVSDVVTMGFRAHVPVDGLDKHTIQRHSGALQRLFEDREFIPRPRKDQMASIGDLASSRHGLYGMLIGCNFGIRKPLYELVGGCDESFTRYGGEDTEFAYRAYIKGALLVPVRDAFAWHQGRWEEDRDRKTSSSEMQRAKMGNLIAHPRSRHVTPGRTFDIPQHVVTIQTKSAPATRVTEVINTILADPICDLTVRVETSLGGTHDDLIQIQDHFNCDPRVHVAPSRAALDHFPASPFHVVLPATAEPTRGIVTILRTWLGDGVQATSVLSDGTSITIARSWALHRAIRTGRDIGFFGDTVTIPVHRLCQPLHALIVRTSTRIAWDPQSRRAGVARLMTESPRLWPFRFAWRSIRWTARRVFRLLPSLRSS